VLCHPAQGSLCAALARAVADGARGAGVAVTVHDLYRDGFDPRLAAAEVESTRFADDLAARYARDLLAADAVAVVHPVWFFGPPAALKGWVERVVREGVAYDVGEDGAVTGRLRARAALVVTTGNAGRATEASLGDTVTRFWRDLVFGPAGVPETRRLAFAPVRGSAAEERAAWIEAARREAATLAAAVRAYLGSHRAEQRRPDEPT
jgi:putative NADPH-quinone reductase